MCPSGRCQSHVTTDTFAYLHQTLIDANNAEAAEGNDAK